MTDSKCPFCGASEGGPIIHHEKTYWRCDSHKQEAAGPWQSEPCKLIVALATVARLTTELKRRDEAIDTDIAATERIDREKVFSPVRSGILIALRERRDKNQKIHDELNRES